MLGSGAVYVIDGSEVSYSNVAEEDLRKTLSIYDMKVHMLAKAIVSISPRVDHLR